MCGICGYVGRGSAATLEAMSSIITHRGPDERGSVVNDGLGLAHRRLAVIDLKGGRQPMASAEADLLVYNGEIYNFRQLRLELERLGHGFSTDSDTEVILRAYRQWGTQCLDRFRGMFAFALWDDQRKFLFLARDRVGIKPLYYTMAGGTFFFASEAKALLQIPKFDRRIDRQALSLYLTFRYTPGENTLFAGVKKLPPGHYMIVQPGSEPQLHRYWKLQFQSDPGPQEGEWRERFWSVFRESVKLRMISDVPLGAYLSGGLDSSLIVAAMSTLATRPVQAFSVGFEDQRFNELPYAQLVARHFGCDHHVLHAEARAGEVLDDVIWHLDEPLADLATIPTFLMAQKTKPLATVVLSGEGADELLAGYPKYRAFLGARMAARLLPSPLCAFGARATRRIALQRVLGALAIADRPAAYLELTSVFSPTETRNLLVGEDENGMLSAEEKAEFVRPYFRGQQDGLSQLLALDFHTWLPDDLLLKNDRMTMAHGVEARVPFLDHELVELCARIPSRFKLGWLQEKVLLRKVMAGRLPETIRRRKKTGFTVPLGHWAKGRFGERLEEVLSEDFVRRQGLFRWDFVSALKARPLDHPYYRRQLWTIAALSLWQQRFGIEI